MDITFLHNIAKITGRKHIRVSQFWRIKVPFQSPFPA
jgi:hypothetical protein